MLPHHFAGNHAQMLNTTNKALPLHQKYSPQTFENKKKQYENDSSQLQYVFFLFCIVIDTF